MTRQGRSGDGPGPAVGVSDSAAVLYLLLYIFPIGKTGMVLWSTAGFCPAVGDEECA